MLGLWLHGRPSVMTRRYPVFAFCLFLGATSALEATIVSYPETNPVLNLDLPQSWKVARQDEGVLILTPEKGNALIMIRRAEHMKDERDAKIELAAMADEAKRMFTLHDVEAVGAATEKDLGSIKGLSGAYTAKDEKEQSAHFQLILFAARQGEFYVMTELYNDDHQLESILERTVLMKSLKPMSGSENR
jgi:hypothetical protein